MALTETFWMACDSTERTRVEYGPFATRAEAEVTARRLRLGYLLRYDMLWARRTKLRTSGRSSSNSAPELGPLLPPTPRSGTHAVLPAA